MRIVYCTDSICYPGGIQTVTIAKANALAEIDGNEVWIVVTDNKRKTVAKVSEKVHVVDLDVNYYEDDWKGYFYVLKGIFVKRRLHKKRLAEVLQRIQPDVVISTGTSEKYFLPRIWVGSHPLFVREIHYPSNYRALHAASLRDRFMAKVGDFVDFKWNIRSYHKIVVLTQADKEENWGNNEKVIAMPNPVTTTETTHSSCKNKIAIAAGRLVDVKNFDGMIRIWSKVVEIYPDWVLNIWGDGRLRQVLQRQIDSMSLEQNVKLCGYSYNIIEEMKKSSMYIMTSHFEGFPTVLVEAMSVGIPVVAYDCPYGPGSIIKDSNDGYLVPNGDERRMADAICSLIEDEQKRKEMGLRGFDNCKRFSPVKIVVKWMKVFK